MQEQAHDKTPFRWLTVEAALYGLIVATACLLRLINLGARLMDTSEATQAWQAWQLMRGLPLQGAYSPLLLSGQSLLFLLFGGSDAAARFWPAWVGGAMAALPWFLRRQLGRWGALAAALALAVSPTLVYVARYGDGAMLLVACATASMTLWLARCDEPQPARRAAYLAAIAVLDGLSLIADPRVIGVLLAVGLAWGIETLFFKRNVLQHGLDQAADWKKWAWPVGVVVLLGATALLWNPAGLGEWADFPARWAAHWAPVVNGQPWYYPLVSLLLYEPLLLFFGLIGAVNMGIRRDEGMIWTWLAVGFLLLALLSGGRNAGDVALVCAPLALLAGRAIQNLIEQWQAHARLEREVAFVAVALVLGVYATMVTAMYTQAIYISDLDRSAQFLWLLLLTVSLMMVLGGLFLAWFGGLPAWRAISTTLALVLTLLSWSAAVGLNFERSGDPYELHVRAAPHQNVADALELMRRLSAQRRGYPTSMPVIAETGLGPLWAWYLRDWEQVEWVDQLTAPTRPAILLADAERLPLIGEDYIGQDFVVRAWWQPGQLDDRDGLAWWFYRKSLSRPIAIQRVVVWIKSE